MHQIKMIPPKETLALRLKILRPYLKSQDECVYEKDNDSDSFHLGIFVDGSLTGIASFERDSCKELLALKPYRLRGMAIEIKDRRKGFGRMLLQRGIEELHARNCDLLWFNAREIAYSFYLGMGFEFASEAFEINNIGTHRIMFKRFSGL